MNLRHKCAWSWACACLCYPVSVALKRLEQTGFSRDYMIGRPACLSLTHLPSAEEERTARS